MPHLGMTVEHQQLAQAGRRMARLYAIADPLWIAIDRGRSQEVARLMQDLNTLVEKDRQGREAMCEQSEQHSGFPTHQAIQC